MKRKLVQLLIIAAMLAPTAAFAGWGAIACDLNGSGACGTSSGYNSLVGAQLRAMRECQAGGYACYFYRWEHNMCINGPNGSYACN
jgi:Domain of unknown function (DUF4189)